MMDDVKALHQKSVIADDNAVAILANMANAA
jgi:hypothetical protein